jgi:hypothetical protein
MKPSKLKAGDTVEVTGGISTYPLQFVRRVPRNGTIAAWNLFLAEGPGDEKERSCILHDSDVVKRVRPITKADSR